MRSVTRAFLRYVLILTLLLSIGAQATCCAETVDCVVFKIDACVAGNEYAFFLTERGASVNSLSGADLYYIDQLKASASEMLVAVVLPDFTGCDAYAGGVFSGDAASPRKLGSYIASRTPEQLQEIEESAFEGSAFTHVILGGNVQTIGSRAFANCAALAYVYVPSSVQSIAADAFSGSNGVIIGCFSGSCAEAFAQQNGIPYKTLG